MTSTFSVNLIDDNRYLIQTIGNNYIFKNYYKDYWDENLYGLVISKNDYANYSKFNLIELFNNINNANLKKINNRRKKKNNKTKAIFHNMSYSKYGKGYLLIPNNGNKHPDWGFKGNKTTNYYHGGWWRDELQGWFFRGSNLKILIDNGAIENF